MIKLRNTTDLQKFFIAKNCARGFIPKLSEVDVEFTENGEFSVTPPTGYVGMSKVNVTVNVETTLYFDENGGTFYTDTESFEDVPEWIVIEGTKVTVQPSNYGRTATIGNLVIEQTGAYEKPLTLEALENGTIAWTY